MGEAYADFDRLVLVVDAREAFTSRPCCGLRYCVGEEEVYCTVRLSSVCWCAVRSRFHLDEISRIKG